MVLLERPGWRQALVRRVKAIARTLAAPVGTAVAVLGAGRLFTLWFWRRAAHLHPPAGIFVTVDGRRLHLVDRGPAGRPPDAAGPRPASPAPDTPAADDPPSARLDAPPTVVLVHGLRGSSAEFTFSIVDNSGSDSQVSGKCWAQTSPDWNRNRVDEPVTFTFESQVPRGALRHGQRNIV